jgi:hypothetical protein
MARKKRKSTPVRRRRKMGAIGGKKFDIMGALATIGGAVAGRYLVKAVNIGSVKPALKNAAVIGIGLFLPKFVKGATGAAIGAGMVAAGGIGIASELLPKIAGVEDAEMDMETLEFPMVMNGIEDGELSLIAGDDDDSVMAGLSVIAGNEDEEDYFM